MLFLDQLNESLRATVASMLAASNDPDVREIEVDDVAFVVPAADERHGDYQANTAMVLAKRMKRNPRELAAEIAAGVAESIRPICEAPEIAGPGFINFRITADAYGKRLGEILRDQRLGVPEVTKRETIVIDFSAPNVAKPMHVGHIRSTIIGDSLARIAKFLGHTVIRDNHIGDWGTQFGMILYGWKNLLSPEALAAEPLPELLRIYREVNAATKADPELREICKAELVKLQSGDEENLAIWQQTVNVSLAGLRKIYQELDIEFDHWFGESHYNERLGPLVEQLLEQGLAQKSEGAIAIFAAAGEAPEKSPFFIQKEKEWVPLPCLIRKSDGGYLYATTDLATIDFRLEELHATAIWYVVGAPQQAHFDQIFAIARRRGQECDFQFIPFGSILGPDRKMLRTRSGETVQLGDVLTEAVERARKIVEEKNADLSDDEKAEIARTIGIGAVKYSELSQHRMTDYIFDWDRMLSLTGRTAPYLQNAYVRTRSIFRKIEHGGDFSLDSLNLAGGEELKLGKLIVRFGEIVPEVLNGFRPNLLAEYLYEVAAAFHSFYEACPVAAAAGDTRKSRLALCELCSQVLKCGLELLGIKVPERM